MRSYSTAWAASSAQRGERRTREDCHHGEREAVSEGNVAENMTVPRKADRANRLDYKALRRRILARVDCGEPAGSLQAALRRRMLARVRQRGTGGGAASGFSETDARSGEALGRGWGGFVFRKAACGDRGDDCRRRLVKAACGGLAEALGRGWGRGDCFFFLILFLYGSRS